MNKTNNDHSSNTHIFQQLVNSAKSQAYPIYSGKNVMELPLYFAFGKSFSDNYDNFASQYLDNLRGNNLDSDTINLVDNLIKNLRKTINEYLNGKLASAYSSFKDAMELIKSLLPIKTIHNRIFYRMRANGGITDIKEFYHIPFDKIYLSQSERFSIEGYPCLYLGYSKHVCEIEVSGGSLAKFALKEPLDNILDLTLGQGDGKKDIPEIDLVKIYPLIASCYIVPFYSIMQKKECRPDKSFFREEYIIPQLLTLYLKEEGIANGIIYYSVKDPNLDLQGIGEKDFRNLVLFTNRENNTNENYDNELISKFDITL
ncbi:MAG: RES domain-containing protein [Prevotella sp.]|nr:RES domain-containing protein [Prevotella sp.]